MSGRNYVSDLAAQAREAANCYATLCYLEGERPLLDPYNQIVLEKLLRDYAQNWRNEIWRVER